MKRHTPLKPRGRRAEREAEALDRFRAEVLGRGKCERCGSKLNLDAHHVRSRARGGDHDPDNGMACCRRCHDAIHRHLTPDWKDWLI